MEMSRQMLQWWWWLVGLKMIGGMDSCFESPLLLVKVNGMCCGHC